MNGQGANLASEFSGPVLFSYVWWVLQEARRLGIHRLYFLARDGYTLKRIAQILCEQFQLDLSLEYLYCSRMSLRLPTYFFLGEEAYDLLLSRSLNPSLRSVLMRAGFTPEERGQIYAECGLREIAETKVLDRKEFAACCSHLRSSGLFRYLVCKKSRDAYGPAVGYLKQCGLFAEEQVAIVDSGWAGSIQRSLRQLMEFAGYTGTITGFYFGTYNGPRVRADGTQHAWYFHGGSSALCKAQFSNNLFECLLSAPHGMTVGYESTPSGYVPVLRDIGQAERELAAEQSDAICRYAKERCGQISFQDFCAEPLLRQTRDRIRRYMMRPTEPEAAYYGQFLFCDDVTDVGQSPLAAPEQKRQLKEYFLLWSIWKRLFPSLFSAAHTELFWPYGTTAFLPPWQAAWWRTNICLSEYLRQLLRRKKERQAPVRTLEAWKRIVAPYDVVSFDIFDTLLYRTVQTPTDVFRLMEPQIYEQDGVKGFARKRICAEVAARRRSDQADVTLKEIYDCFDATPEQRIRWMRLEQETERQVLRADPIMGPLLQYCVACKKNGHNNFRYVPKQRVFAKRP